MTVRGTRRFDVWPLLWGEMLLLYACRQPPQRPPPPPPLDGALEGSVGCCVGGGSLDGGERSDAAADLGVTPAGVCRAPTPADAITAPAGWTVRRVIARWDPESCGAPELVLALSTRADCSLDDAMRLELRLTAAAVDEGLVFVGVNPLSSLGDQPLRIRLVGAAGGRVLGPCATEGQVVLEDLGTTAGSRIAGEVLATLVDCTSPLAPGTVVEARFDVTLDRGRDAACGPAL
jgi:hypothetical protein